MQSLGLSPAPPACWAGVIPLDQLPLASRGPSWRLERGFGLLVLAWRGVFFCPCCFFGVCCVSSFLVLPGDVWAFGGCWSLLEPVLNVVGSQSRSTTTPYHYTNCPTKMHVWRRRCIRCIYEGVSADEDVFMNAKMYSWRFQRWRRCIYECEDVFMKVSALTKMYLWRRRCIHEGVSADEDVFIWRRRCIYEGVSADEDVFMKAKMYLWRCQRWRRCIYEGEDVFMKVLEWTCWQRCIYEGEDVSMKVVSPDVLTKMYLWRRRCIY